jgi:hypothetical protein
MWTGGEFQKLSGKGGIQQTIARRQFLIIASELYQVTVELRDKVLPLYRRLDDTASVAMREWCDRYRLGQPWVLQQVKESLDFWTVFSLQVAQLDKANPPWHPLFDIVVRRPRPEVTNLFAFAYQCEVLDVTAQGSVKRRVPAGWDLEMERKEQFTAEARRQFNAALNAYCAEQEFAARQKGCVRIKRSRAGDYSLRSKIRWAVQRNCGRMLFEEIADDHTKVTKRKVDASTIGRVVREIFDLIEIDDIP